MTNKLEIRQLAELACGTHQDSPEYKRFLAAMNPTLLLDLTAAPVVERQELVVSEADLIAAGFGYPMSKEDSMKAYKASLQPRTDHPSNEDCEWCHGCGHDPYGDPCIGCCKPNPEPVYLYRRKGNAEWTTCDRPRFVEFSSHKMFDTKICFASPPAPVAADEDLALLDRHEAWMAGVENGKASVDSAIDENAEFDKWRNTQIDVLVRNGYLEGAEAFRNLGSVQWAGWQARACLDKVKELNQ